MAYWRLVYIPAFGGAEMKKQGIVVAAVVMAFFLSVLGAAAQGPGPQGVGAQEAAQKSDSPHSYNPIKWIKKDKDSSATTEKPKKAKNKKSSEKPATPDTPAPPKS
jgi:hypothetical protein